MLSIAPGKDTLFGCQGNGVSLSTRDGQNVLAEQLFNELGLERVREVSMAEGSCISSSARHDNPILVDEEAKLTATLNPACAHESVCVDT